MGDNHAFQALLLSALAVVAITVLAVLHDTIPEILPAIAGGGLAGGAGLAPGRVVTSVTSRRAATKASHEH